MENAGRGRTGQDLEGLPGGLTQELAAFFGGQLQFIRDNKGRRCPGERQCAETGPIAEADGTGLSVQEICADCELLPSKPPRGPRLLIEAINFALDYELLHEAGAAGTIYPGPFHPRQVVALRTLREARREAEEEARREAENRQREDVERARLEAMRARGR